MKILHTADLHLGKFLNGLNLIDNQIDMLNQIVNIVKANNIDVVCIAGDVYDRSIANLEAINAFESFLSTLIVDNKKNVIIIPGNHDSNDRLTFGKNILSKSGLYMFSNEDINIQKLTLEDQYGNVNFYLWPNIGTFTLQSTFPLCKTYNDC